ncbi:MAG: 50S ribosomal protein L30 [Proteobacteria bacterium]|nr:50S ribosomal protein L30 [Pseudomonadota bacterium]
MNYVYVKQVRSVIGSPHKVASILKSMGLGRIGKSRTFRDTRAIRGQINKVSHLVTFELKQDKTT